MLTLPAHIAKITTMADGSWRLVADLGELSPEQVGELSKTANKVVCLALTLEESFSKQEQEVLEKTKDNEQEGRETQDNVVRLAKWLG